MQVLGGQSHGKWAGFVSLRRLSASYGIKHLLHCVKGGGILMNLSQNVARYGKALAERSDRPATGWEKLPAVFYYPMNLTTV